MLNKVGKILQSRKAPPKEVEQAYDSVYDNAEHCVCCGRDIPEGRQVCVICGKVGKGKQTNYDRIRNMSVEELTFFLFELGDHNTTICNILCGGYKSKCGRSCVAKLKQWLEAEVTE